MSPVNRPDRSRLVRRMTPRQIMQIVDDLGFEDCVELLRAWTDRHYPTEVFAFPAGFHADPGHKFVARLRDAIRFIDEEKSQVS